MLAYPKKTKEQLVSWIQNYFEQNGKDCCAVIGISGGKDSSIIAALCVEAIGKERVIGVLMPNGEQADIQDSRRLVEHLGISYKFINIEKTVWTMTEALEEIMRVSEQTKINLPARIRMATLYAIAQSLPNGGRVANTCNRSEDFIGYSTKYGDSIGDFSPLQNLMVHEVRQIGYELDLPKDLVDKTPSDGLCGKTDEDNLGFTYGQLDDYIMHGSCGDRVLDEVIEKMHKRNMHKLELMPAYLGY